MQQADMDLRWTLAQIKDGKTAVGFSIHSQESK